MAKKRDTTTGKMGKWNGIASVPFNSPERAEFDSWANSDVDVMEQLRILIEEDYKLSLSLENRTGAIMASLSCYNKDDVNYKYTLISRAPNVYAAIAVTVFKHYVVAAGKWTDATPPDADLWG